MQRRLFLASPLMAVPLAAAPAAEEPDARIVTYGDGIPHTPVQYAQLLERLAPAPDSYSIGGVVEQLETRVAAILGKETAVWLPTGTLANHLAVRLLAGPRRRVLVQAESHLFNDEGDCAQTLSGLNLIPLAPGRATFTLEDVEKVAADAMQGRVATPLGAIQIETPVRRRNGERFNFGEMKKICGWARAHGVGLHLDGARVFLEGAPVKEYAALFDTVYISMYKYFNAAAGAVLAGPKALLGELFHTRRMFGGSITHAWPYAAVALHYMEGFEGRFAAATKSGEQVLAALAADPRFGIERIPNGTNVFRLRVKGIEAAVYRQRLEAAGVAAQAAAADWFTMQVNETWNRVAAAGIVARFSQALG